MSGWINLAYLVAATLFIVAFKARFGGGLQPFPDLRTPPVISPAEAEKGLEIVATLPVAPGNVAEELLYDFDPAVGDIIPGFDRLGCSQPEEVVTLMDSVLIGSTYRKQWHCGTFPNTNTLIEGIGFISGVLEGCATGMPDGPFNVLDCFSQDGLTLFSNGMDACDLQTLVPRSSPAVVRTIVYPDPFFDRAMVRFERQLAQATVLVLDPSGRAVRTVAPVSGEQLILQRDGLAPGCYSIVLVESGQRTGAARMVVQDR